jgi:hypothetical protein
MMIFMGQMNISAQTFISNAKKWSIVERNIWEEIEISSSYYKFFDDTLIDDARYKKLYRTDKEQTDNWYFDSAWKEENNRVYKYDDVAGSEVLVYDYNLQKTDSFYYRMIEGYLNVDSVGMKAWGGKVRKHLYLSSPGYSDQITIWRQGVGQDGLITRSSEIGIDGAFISLLCFYEDSELLYQNPDYDKCCVQTSVDKMEKELELIRCWLSGDNELLVELLIVEEGIISFFANNGVQIYKQRIDKKLTTISIPTDGVYVFQFESENGEFQSGKIHVK